jgi:NTP pyrophosphatase (non-canonical NTP hydrolase)
MGATMNEDQKSSLLKSLGLAINAGEKALEKFGPAFQKNMAREEMAELLVAMAREERGRDSENEVRGEIADVLITALELVSIYGVDECISAINTKVKRLNRRIETANNVPDMVDISARVKESAIQERKRIVKYLKSVSHQFAIGDMVEQDDFVADAYLDAAHQIDTGSHLENES